MVTFPINSVKPAARQTMLVLGTPADWQADAVEAYRRAEHDDATALRSGLIRRVAVLTGRIVSPDEIFLDRAGRQATVAVDGVVFRLERGELVVVRQCTSCGMGAIASPPIDSRADLGYALAAWEPRCDQDALDDEEEDRTYSW